MAGLRTDKNQESWSRSPLLRRPETYCTAGFRGDFRSYGTGVIMAVRLRTIEVQSYLQLGDLIQLHGRLGFPLSHERFQRFLRCGWRERCQKAGPLSNISPHHSCGVPFPPIRHPNIPARCFACFLFAADASPTTFPLSSTTHLNGKLSPAARGPGREQKHVASTMGACTTFTRPTSSRHRSTGYGRTRSNLRWWQTCSTVSPQSQRHRLGRMGNMHVSKINKGRCGSVYVAHTCVGDLVLGSGLAHLLARVVERRRRRPACGSKDTELL